MNSQTPKTIELSNKSALLRVRCPRVLSNVLLLMKTISNSIKAFFSAGKILSISFFGRAGAIIFFSIIFCSSQGICSGDIDPTPVSISMDRILKFSYWLPMMSTFNPKDAQIALKVWLEKWGKNTGMYDKAEASPFHDLSELVEALSKNRWDLVLLPIIEFLEIEKKSGLSPDFTMTRGGIPGDEYVVLAHKESNINDLPDLRGRKFIVSTRFNNDNILFWVDYLLQARGFPQIGEFVEEIIKEDRDMKVVLPVFFRKADACVLSRLDFELMTELNPQVGRNLKIIASSQRFLPFVICIASHINGSRRDALQKSILNLHEDVDFMQILLLHKMEGLVAINENDMLATRNLISKYGQCKKQ